MDDTIQQYMVPYYMYDYERADRLATMLMSFNENATTSFDYYISSGNRYT